MNPGRHKRVEANRCRQDREGRRGQVDRADQQGVDDGAAAGVGCPGEIGDRRRGVGEDGNEIHGTVEDRHPTIGQRLLQAEDIRTTNGSGSGKSRGIQIFHPSSVR